MSKWIISVFVLMGWQANAQPVMETGGQKMPDEWIDKSPGNKQVRLTRMEGSSGVFEFHTKPFVGTEMVFYNSRRDQTGSGTEKGKTEMYTPKKEKNKM